MSLLDKTLIIKEQVNQMKAKLNLPPDTPIQTVTDSITSGGGGGDTNVYRVKTLEERDAITTAKEGDLCIVIDSTTAPITAQTEFSSVTFPETVVLDSAMTDYADVMFRSVDPNQRIDCWGSLDSRSFRADFRTGNPETDLRVNYRSSDGVTYTRQRYSTGAGPAPTPFNFGTNIKYERPEYWNPAIGKFMISGSVSFEGIFEYKEGAWTFAKIGANATADKLWAPAKLYTDNGMVESTLARNNFNRTNIYIQSTPPDVPLEPAQGEQGKIWLTLQNPKTPDYNLSNTPLSITYTHSPLDNDTNLFEPTAYPIPFDFNVVSSFRNTDTNYVFVCTRDDYASTSNYEKFRMFMAKNKIYFLYEDKTYSATPGEKISRYLSVFNIDTGVMRDRLYTFPVVDNEDFHIIPDDLGRVILTTFGFSSYSKRLPFYVIDPTTDTVAAHTTQTTVEEIPANAVIIKDKIAYLDYVSNRDATVVETIDLNTGAVHTSVLSKSYNTEEICVDRNDPNKEAIGVKEDQHGVNARIVEIDINTGATRDVPQGHVDGWIGRSVVLSKEHNLYRTIMNNYGPMHGSPYITFGSVQNRQFVYEEYFFNIKDVSIENNTYCIDRAQITYCNGYLYLYCVPRYGEAALKKYYKRVYKLDINKFIRFDSASPSDLALEGGEYRLLVKTPLKKIFPLKGGNLRAQVTDRTRVTAGIESIDFCIPLDDYSGGSTSSGYYVKEDTDYTPHNMIKDIYIHKWGEGWVLYKSHTLDK